LPGRTLGGDGRPAAEEPYQPPTLIELEDARAGVALGRQIALKSLIASEDAPDVEHSEVPGPGEAQESAEGMFLSFLDSVAPAQTD